MKNLQSEKLNAVIDEMYLQILDELKKYENRCLIHYEFHANKHEYSYVQGRFDTIQIKDGEIVFNFERGFEFGIPLEIPLKEQYAYHHLQEIMTSGEMYDMLDYIFAIM